MRQSRFSIRLLALLFSGAIALTAAACSQNTVEPAPGESSSSVSQPAGIPAFINPLGDVDLSRLSTAEKPSEDTLNKMNAAYGQNNDVVGWLYLPGTTIDEAVLQGTDNDYYLRKNITKAYDFNGCYYADYECSFGDRNGISQNTIIYGHSMDDNPDGDRFSQLKKYLDPEFLKAHPYLYFSTPEDTMAFKVFSVMYTDDNLAYLHPEMKNAQFLALVKEMRERSQFDIDVDVNITDKILSLSTCTYIYGSREDQRFVVTGRLVRPGEEMDTPIHVEPNPDPKPPQF